MKVADGLEMLEISTISTGRNGIINPVLLWDDKSAILIDAGLPGQMPLIRESIKRAGLAFNRLTNIIITHHDLDHIGSLRDIQNELGENLKVISHTEEKPYIEYEKNPLKMNPEKIAELMPMLKSKVDRVVGHGEELEECGGVTIIYTPGHTPGHICLYLKKHKLLVAGDALNVVDGILLGPNPKFSPEFEQAKKSLKKLAEHDIEAVICYHGGLFRGNINDRILELSEL